MKLILVFLGLVLGAAALPDIAFDFQEPAKSKEIKDNERSYQWDVPSTDRYQWSHNYGYCGEVCSKPTHSLVVNLFTLYHNLPPLFVDSLENNSLNIPTSG